MKYLFALLLLLNPSAAQPDLNKPFLARVTTYQSHEDPLSAKGLTATGAKLEKGVAAVDPNKIPYHSKINIPGVGIVVAKDTGRDVKNRKAARLLASTYQQFKSPVIDVYDPNNEYKNLPEYIMVTVEK